jgi:hypothetical protein
MKKFLFITLIYLAASATTVDESKFGPAYNYKNQGSRDSCTERAVYSTDSEMLLDDNTTISNEKIPGGVSDCVDLLLWDNEQEKYFDRCCYVRFQYQGNMHAGCIPLMEEDYLDTTITIRRMEDGDKRFTPYWPTYLANSKIYQLDCISSNLKALSFTSILLLALFF